MTSRTKTWMFGAAAALVLAMSTGYQETAAVDGVSAALASEGLAEPEASTWDCEGEKLSIWDDQPAQHCEKEAYPIGKVDSLWTGGDSRERKDRGSCRNAGDIFVEFDNFDEVTWATGWTADAPPSASSSDPCYTIEQDEHGQWVRVHSLSVPNKKGLFWDLGGTW